MTGTAFPTYTPPGYNPGPLTPNPSKWYGPYVGSPATLPVAGGSNALAAGNAATANGSEAVVMGNNATGNGNYSAVYGSNASGALEVVAAGYLANGSASYTTAVGSNTVANTQYATVFGAYSEARASYTTTIGASAAVTAVGTGGSAFGFAAACRFPYAVAVGYASDTKNAAELTFSNVAGGTTKGRFVVPQQYAATIDATPTLAASDSGAYIAFFANSISSFTLYVSAQQPATGDCASWIITGSVKNIGGTYTLIGSSIGAGAPTYNDAGAALWTVGLAAGASGLTVTVTGEAAKTIAWSVTCVAGSQN